MASERAPVTCFIAGIVNREIDPTLQEFGFTHGIIIFAIPEFGILFRCRAEGDPVSLEFGAFFALLRFIRTTLNQTPMDRVQICSSNPELVTSFNGQGRYLAEGTAWAKMLAEYTKSIQIDVRYVEPIKNRCLLSPADYPSTPAGAKPVLKPDLKPPTRLEIKPIQKGIKL